MLSTPSRTSSSIPTAEASRSSVKRQNSAFTEAGSRVAASHAALRVTTNPWVSELRTLSWAWNGSNDLTRACASDAASAAFSGSSVTVLDKQMSAQRPD
jgi:hypothetical protein